MGIYSYLEDKWYNLVDWLNSYVPVSGLVDSVDKVIPSFLLFLALLILFLVGIFIFVFSSGGIGVDSFQAEVTVLSRQGAPVVGAVVTFGQSCSSLGNVSLSTDFNGRAVFKACSTFANVRVSKEGYSTLSEDISFENNKAKIYLSAITSTPRILNLKVKDGSNKIITNAEVYLLCSKAGVIDENLVANKNQSSSGFLIELPSGCDSIQAKAIATGYNEKRESIGLNVENKTIVLSEIEDKGSVVFNVDSNAGKKEAIILVSDELGAQDTILVDSTGVVTKEYDAGSYSYTATLYGITKTGTFIVTTGQTSSVDIFFSEVTASVVALLPPLGTTPSGTPTGPAVLVYLKLLDGNSGVGGAEVRVFYKKGNDTNYFTKLSSSYSGLVGPSLVSDVNNREYFVIIKSLEYETKLVKVDLKRSGELAQEINLSKGGADLKIRVIDDTNSPVKNAVISLKKSDFGALFEEPETTDANGRVEFKSLPDGYYSIKGVSSTQEGTINSLHVTSDTEVVLKIITGTGNVKFNLLHNGESVNAYCELFEKLGGVDNSLLSSALTTNGYYQATALRAEKKIYLGVADSNYIYVESPIVEVKRAAQTRNIILYKQSDLPNANKVQMFLEGVFDSNPWTGSEVKSTKLMPGQKYYFLFTLIADNDESLNTYANVFVSPRDKNVIDANTKLFLESAFSTRTSIVRTSSAMNSSIIPEDNVDSIHAKQLNVYLGEQQGLLAFPMVVEVSVGANASGATSLYWEGLAGDVKSILYSKEFVIGQSFCFGANDCPELLFSNYFKRSDTNVWSPIGTDYPLMQLGDEYDLKVIVENLTDRQIGTANIVGKIKSSSQTKLLFKNDLNSVSSSVNVSLRDSNWSVFGLKPLATSPSATLIESLEKGTELKEYNGNNPELKFNIRNKEDINIQVIATGTLNTIFADSEYALFYLKTFYKSNRAGVQTTWDVKVKGANSSFATSITDVNGEWLGEMDFSGLAKGTIVVFSAQDTNNSNPAHLEITLGETVFNLLNQTIPDCISVKIGGVDIKTMSYPNVPIVSAVVGSTGGSFVVDSNCSSARDILIKSDLGVNTGGRFTLGPNENRVVSVIDPASVVVARAGMLGAYPLQIMQIVDGTKFSQVGSIDVIVTEENSVFSILNPIFDMRIDGSVSGVITNNSDSVRQDIYYPQLDISTNSVGLTYTRPGVPETIKFNAIVKSHAIEALTSGYHYGSIIQQGTKEEDCSTTKTLAYTPEELTFTDLAQSHVEKRVEEINKGIEDANLIETLDSPDRDPTKSFYDLPVSIQDKIRSELYPTTGTYTITAPVVSTAPLEIKEQKISFAETPSGSAPQSYQDMMSQYGQVPKMPTDDLEPHGNPSQPMPGDVYVIYPKMAGNYLNSSCPPLLFALNEGSNTGCGSGEDTATIGSKGIIDKLAEGVSKSQKEGSTVFNPMCSQCEIIYKRVIVRSKGPKGFAGITCGQAFVDAELAQENGDVPPGVVIANDGNNNIWTRVIGGFVGRLGVIQLSGCDPCLVDYFGGKNWTGSIYTKGKQEGFFENATLGIAGDGGSNAQFWVTDEYSNAATYFNERIFTWDKNVEFKPREGTVVRLEPRYSYTVNPEWMNIDEVVTEEDISKAAGKDILLKETLIVPHGLVPFSVAKDYVPADVNSPLVEYRNNGLIYSEIPADSVPPGVRLFLKGGYVYAEYIGDDKTQAGNEINFTISKVNLQGSEYAIITVRDWVNGEKVEKIFQVKLLANPNNCYSLEGLAGLTGKEFVPKLLFNWDWNGINYNQCDSTNPNYTYCDATQFTISMFKRLGMINDALIVNNNRLLPQYASFYAYLIKDGYSEDFLRDFDQYYSTTPFLSSGFNSTSDSTGYDKFITENRIEYYFKNGGNVVLLDTLEGLPKGGLYRVEVGFDFDNSAVKSLFNQNNTNAQINVTFTLISEAPNYNLFYETPFDGEVGKQANGTFSRNGYGVSLNQGEIPITDSGNSPLKIRNYSGTPLVSLTYTSSNNLIDLMNQKVLIFKDNGSLEFNPMQPTPIVMTIKDTNLNLNFQPREIRAPYIMSGFDSSVKTDRAWKLVSSTLGNSGKCTDFSSNQTYSFIEQTNGAEKYFKWSNVTKSGTIELATIFFNPPKSIGSTAVDVSSAYSANVKLLTVANSSLASGTSVQLDYFGSSYYEKYKSLKGMFEMIAEGKLCVSQNAVKEMQVWWNQDYLNSLIELVNYNKSQSCID